MITYEDECVGCPTEMGCLGDTCPKRNVVHLICDECGDDAEELWEKDGQHYCEDCMRDCFGFKKVEI